MQKIMLAALLFALTFLGIQSVNSQSNPFNPDFSWCNTQGAIATRKANKWDCLLPGSSGQVVQSGGPGADISWLTIPGTGTVTSVAATVPSFMAVSGSPITIAGTLGFSFNNQTTNLVFASPNGSTGAPSFRSLAVNDIPTLTAAKLPNAGVMTGDVTTTFPAVTIGANAITTTKINNAAVTGAKIDSATITGANIATNTVANSNLVNFPANTLIANLTGGAATPTHVTGSNLLDSAIGSTQGTIAYRNATTWTALTPGSTGEFLKTNGAGANPQWAAVPGAAGGTVQSVTCGAGLTGGTFTVTGTCDLSNVTSAGQYPGTATNNNATAGNIGEHISASVAIGGATTMPLAGTPVALMSITLTPGDWDVSASCAMTGGTQPTNFFCSLDTLIVVNAFPGRFAQLSLNVGSFTTAGIQTLAIPPTRFSVSTNTTIYMVGSATGASDSSGWGELRARRMR